MGLYRLPDSQHSAGRNNPMGKTMMSSSTPEQRLVELGFVLPPPAAAVANYVPWAITGNLIMTSGNLPWRDGKLAYTGKIGRELSGEDGYKCCQLSCLNAIAQLRDAAGDLSRIIRVVRLEGTMNVAEGFGEHPKCLNGASDKINEVFGVRGLHTRMIYTNPVMPLDCVTLVVLYAEIAHE
jgi:enamine deaminase RidA (YjgF/YER057c/UK114 family)